jgi:hypothetical protein
MRRPAQYLADVTTKATTAVPTDAVRLMQAERIGWAAALERVRRRRVRRFARRIRLARYQRASARPMVYRLTKGMVA